MLLDPSPLSTVGGEVKMQMRCWARVVAMAAGVMALITLGGCITTSVIAMAVEQTPAAQGHCLTFGCAAREVVAYAYDKATEGDPAPCRRLNSVARALAVRCGAYESGTLVSKDVAASGLPICPLTLAARDPRLWPVLTELLAKGAQPEVCAEAPLAALARANPCPDFKAASPDALRSLRWLAEADVRSIQHDVVRLLSCPQAQRVGLDGVVADWIANGQLPDHGLAFSPLAALHPSVVPSTLSAQLEAAGHRAASAFGAYQGRLATGFEDALRQGNVAAIDWWLVRAPELANRVPAPQGNQSAWLPLAHVVRPGFVADASRQAEVVELLLSHGADPRRRLPYDPSQSVLMLARQLRTPVLALLESPPGASSPLMATAADTPRLRVLQQN